MSGLVCDEARLVGFPYDIRILDRGRSRDLGSADHDGTVSIGFDTEQRMPVSWRDGQNLSWRLQAVHSRSGIARNQYEYIDLSVTHEGIDLVRGDMHMGRNPDMRTFECQPADIRADRLRSGLRICERIDECIALSECRCPISEVAAVKDL